MLDFGMYKLENEAIRKRIKPSITDFSYLLTVNNLIVFKVLLNLIKKVNFSVLDLGCGYKPFKFILGKNVKYIGADLSEKYAEPDVICDLNKNKLPFKDNVFDVVILSEVLEHLYNPFSVLAEAIRYVKPNGFIFISSPWAFPEHGEPYDFYRYSLFFYKYIAKLYDLEVVYFRKSNTILSMGFMNLNFFVRHLPIPSIFKKSFFFLINILSLILDKLSLNIAEIIKCDKCIKKLYSHYAGIAIIYKK